VETLGEAGLPYLVVPSVEAWMAATDVDDESALPALAVIDSAVDSFAVHDRFKDVAPSVPVIVVVASGTRGDAARCRERGVRGYLAKPTDPGDLVDVIRSTMGLIAAGDETTLVTRHWLREGRSSLHVLVVDDSTTSRFLLTRMLEQRGHSTTQATDGREAIEAIEHGSFDVVLMDVLMPEMGGLEATRRIRDMHTATDDRPYIVGVSAFADQDNVDRAFEAGMDDFLSKPIRPDDLFAVVERTRKVELANA
jgi:CheY-like chemotaxis protein